LICFEIFSFLIVDYREFAVSCNGGFFTFAGLRFFSVNYYDIGDATEDYEGKLISSEPYAPLGETTSFKALFACFIENMLFRF
jgi:hypothetical protein